MAFELGDDVEVRVTPYSAEWYATMKQTLGQSVCRRLGFYEIPDDLLLSVVIPIYNERETILDLVDRVRSVPVRKELVLNIDVAPTLLELAGVESIIPMHGKSLVPLLRDADAPWREAFLAEYFLEKVAPRTSTWQAVRTHDWKYIHYLEFDSLDELYHLEADPKELKNLVNHPAHQTRLEVMRAQLQELAKQSK